MSTGTVNCSSRWKVSLWVRLGSNLLLQKPTASREQGPQSWALEWVPYYQTLPHPTQNPFEGQKVDAETPAGSMPVDTQLIGGLFSVAFLKSGLAFSHTLPFSQEPDPNQVFSDSVSLQDTLSTAALSSSWSSFRPRRYLSPILPQATTQRTPCLLAQP